MCTLRAVYEWLRVLTTANHILMCALHTPYACLRAPYACLTRIYARLTCTLRMSTRALQVYDWLRVPTTANQITAFKNLINIKS